MAKSIRIMHIDLDAFFVSVEQVFNPALRGKPVVVGGRLGQRGVVTSASYETRPFGLHAGMPLSHANRLCPQAIFVESNFSRYRETSRRFMAILADFSPEIEPGGLDEAYLDATGFESIYGSVGQMVSSLKERIRCELGIVASIGIASNKLVAKVASAESKPDGLLESAVGKEAAFLAPLPIRKLPGVGKKTEEVLIGLGVKTIGDITDLPVNTMKRRFGVFGEHLIRSARGIDESKVRPPGEAKSISRETTFARDIADSDHLEATLSQLSENVAADLRKHNKQARHVTLKLRWADFTTITRSCTLKQATGISGDISGAGKQLLKRELLTRRQPVRLIGIGISGLVTPAQQLNMLDDKSQRLEQINVAIDKIRDKYGFTAVGTGRLLALKDMFSDNSEGHNPPKQQ